MTNTLLFSRSVNGGITFTGNAIGLSKKENSQNAGTANSIGALMSSHLDYLQVPTYPPYTTLNYLLDSSTAILNIPKECDVAFAVLSWGGCCKVPGENRISPVSNNVRLKAVEPSLPTEYIFQDRTYFTDKTKDVVFYSCYSIVTREIKKSMSAKYSVAEFPVTSEATDNSNNCGGWTLAVVYTNPSLPARYISIYAGLEEVTSSNFFSITSSFPTTPKLGPQKGRALLSAMHASATLGDNKVLFGPNEYNLVYLSGPRNLSNHFFGSQINDDNGNLDISGSFGDLNQDILTGTNIVGGRQGWDITNVDVSPGLSNSQTSSILKFTTTDNNYLLNMFGLQIDIDVPKLNNINKTTSQVFASIDDIIEYNISIPNNTSSTLNNILLTDILPVGLSYVSNSLTINGNPSGDSLITGVNLGNLAPSQTILVKFKVTVNLEPNNNFDYANFATVNYTVGNPPNIISATAKSNISKLYSSSIIIEPTINISANPTMISLDDIVEYTIKISNTEITPIENAVLTNTLPSEFSYMPNSLTINNISIDSTPDTAISLGTINPWQTIIIKFKATVNSNNLNSEYIDSANLIYKFNTADGPLPNNIKVTNTINHSSIGISPILVKNAVSSNPNPSVANVDDTINYTINVHNPSNKIIRNVIIKDSLPNGLLLKSDSLTINNKPTSGNIETGINLGNISPSDTVIVNYIAKVIPFCYKNSAIVTYEFLSTNNTLLNNSVVTSNAIYFDNTSNSSHNIEPLVFNYKKTIYKNNSITIKVGSFELNGNKLKYTIYNFPKNGYAKITLDGILKYTPKVNFIGTDTFDILIEDENSNSSISNVAIVINDFPSSLGELDCCNIKN